MLLGGRSQVISAEDQKLIIGERRIKKDDKTGELIVLASLPSSAEVNK